MRLTPEELAGLDLADTERREKLQTFCDRFWGLPSDDSLYSCGAGRQMFHVDPYGRLSLCITDRAHTYDLREGTFEEAWRGFIPSVLSQRAEQMSKCTSCPARALCGQCPAWSHMEHQDLETPVEYLCKVGHYRAQALRGGYQWEENTDETPSWQEAV